MKHKKKQIKRKAKDFVFSRKSGSWIIFAYPVEEFVRFFVDSCSYGYKPMDTEISVMDVFKWCKKEKGLWLKKLNKYRRKGRFKEVVGKYNTKYRVVHEFKDGSCIEFYWSDRRGWLHSQYYFIKLIF